VAQIRTKDRTDQASLGLVSGLALNKYRDEEDTLFAVFDIVIPTDIEARSEPAAVNIIDLSWLHLQLG